MEVIKSFEKASGIKINYEIAPRRQGDVGTCFADITMSQKEIGWKAERNIEKMCLDEWSWQKLNPKGYEE